MSGRRLGVAGALVEGTVVPGDVEVVGGRVGRVGCAPAGPGGLAAPGFVDLHVHGHGGIDFLTADGDGYRTAGATMAASGVTAYQPTLLTAPLPELRRALRVVRHLVQAAAPGPRVLGAHLEGPFLAPGRLGAHPAAARLAPDPSVAAALLATGAVTEVTLAPELPGAPDLVEQFAAAGVAVSLGHSDATGVQAAAAATRGARSVTHLCNAMAPLHHRAPGLAGWALADDHVAVELIVDGHHLHDDLVRLAWRAAGPRVVLVTDGTAASGTSAGEITMNGMPLTVAGGAVRTADGTLAGSALTMIEAVRNLHALGVPLAAAIGAATAAPARVLRRDDLGAVRAGTAADLVVIDDRLDVRETLVGGRTVHRA